MKKVFKTLLISLSVFLVACTVTPTVNIDSSLNEKNAAKVIVYRPSSAWAGVALDYRISLNDSYVGSLDPGSQVEFFAPVGANSIAVEDYFMGVGNKKFTMPIEVSAGKEYYIRFSQHIDDVIYTPNGSILSGGARLTLVSVEQWGSRK